MHLILVQHDSQEAATDAIDLLIRHGYTAAFPTPGACGVAGLLDMAGQMVAEASTAVDGGAAALHLNTAGLNIGRGIQSLPECFVCRDRGWHRMATNGDTSRQWVERCDECAAFPDDNEAAKHASFNTGRPVRWAHPYASLTAQPYLVAADPTR